MAELSCFRSGTIRKPGGGRQFLDDRCRVRQKRDLGLSSVDWRDSKIWRQLLSPRWGEMTPVRTLLEARIHLSAETDRCRVRSHGLHGAQRMLDCGLRAYDLRLSDAAGLETGAFKAFVQRAARECNWAVSDTGLREAGRQALYRSRVCPSWPCGKSALNDQREFASQRGVSIGARLAKHRAVRRVPKQWTDALLRIASYALRQIQYAQQTVDMGPLDLANPAERHD